MNCRKIPKEAQPRARNFQDKENDRPRCAGTLHPETGGMGTPPEVGIEGQALGKKASAKQASVRAPIVACIVAAIVTLSFWCLCKVT
jgi:hypothetical protein